MGQLLYLSQNNDCGSSVSSSDRFKFIDDLSLLDIIRLILCVSDYNIIDHVPSDIPTEGKFIENDKINSQQILDNIAEWTEANKMKLNEEKRKYMYSIQPKTFNLVSDCS